MDLVIPVGLLSCYYFAVVAEIIAIAVIINFNYLTTFFNFCYFNKTT